MLDLDIKGFFDNLDHTLLMRAVRRHTDCKWILLYVERWLTAPMQLADGNLQVRTKGTPQGGVISPLLANLFLHYAFDQWMKRNYPTIAFERYADDIVVHGNTEKQCHYLKAMIKKRLKECNLTLHPDKTKIVYCKSSNRKADYSMIQFDFLGYTFRPRLAKNQDGVSFVSFAPALSNTSAKSIRQTMKKWKLHLKVNRELEEIAQWINPILHGWINYYGCYRKSAIDPIFRMLNRHLVKWVTHKYGRFRNRPRRAMYWLGNQAAKHPKLFAHWAIGIKPPVRARRAV